MRRSEARAEGFDHAATVLALRDAPEEARVLRHAAVRPVGDLGHPRTDARLLLAVLAAGGRAAALLRQAGVDEAAVRTALGPVDDDVSG